MQSGGQLHGPSHARGGIPIEAEGGEYIIKNDSVNPETKPILEHINNTGRLPMASGGYLAKKPARLLGRANYHQGGSVIGSRNPISPTDLQGGSNVGPETGAMAPGTGMQYGELDWENWEGMDDWGGGWWGPGGGFDIDLPDPVKIPAKASYKGGGYVRPRYQEGGSIGQTDENELLQPANYTPMDPKALEQKVPRPQKVPMPQPAVSEQRAGVGVPMDLGGGYSAMQLARDVLLVAAGGPTIYKGLKKGAEVVRKGVDAYKVQRDYSKAVKNLEKVLKQETGAPPIADNIWNIGKQPYTGLQPGKKTGMIPSWRTNSPGKSSYKGDKEALSNIQNYEKSIAKNPALADDIHRLKVGNMSVDDMKAKWGSFIDASAKKRAPGLTDVATTVAASTAVGIGAYNFQIKGDTDNYKVGE